MIVRDSKSELYEYLSSDEELIWAGKPKSGIVFRPSDIFLIPFSIFWCGFAIVWVIMAANASLLFSLFGLPFVAIGLFIVFGRFLVDARNRSNTIYGITRDRLIIRSGIFSQKVKSLNIRTLSDISYAEKADGSGTITFGSSLSTFGMNRTMFWPGMKRTPSFDLIPDVRIIYDIIIKLQREG